MTSSFHSQNIQAATNLGLRTVGNIRVLAECICAEPPVCNAGVTPSWMKSGAGTNKAAHTAKLGA